jgi:hypothetical protein
MYPLHLSWPERDLAVACKVRLGWMIYIVAARQRRTNCASQLLLHFSERLARRNFLSEFLSSRPVCGFAFKIRPSPVAFEVRGSNG